MAGSPLFVFGEDKQELELEDCDEDFEGVNHLLVSSTDGPMIVSLEFRTSTAVEAEDVGCSTACTVFWDQDPVSLAPLYLTAADLQSTTILSRTLDEITSVLDARLKQGYDTSTFHYTKDLIKDVMASVGADEDDQMSLVSLTVSLCHTIRSVSSSRMSRMALIRSSQLSMTKTKPTLALLVDWSKGIWSESCLGPSLRFRIAKSRSICSMMTLAYV